MKTRIIRKAARRVRTPADEVREIMMDLEARPTCQPLMISANWKAQCRQPFDADRLAKEFAESSHFFKRDRRIRSYDHGDAIHILIAYCAEAQRAWSLGSVTEAWTFAVSAARWHGIVLTLYEIGGHSEIEKQAAWRLVAEAGARAKLKNDPKQAGKLRVKEQWNAWQSGETRYLSDADFARKVYEAGGLSSPTTVERWSRQWRKKRKAGDHPWQE